MTDTDDESPSNQVQEIQERDIKDEMSESYIDYSMSIIVGRAIPDVRDGLKPVHRRILYSMEVSNFHYDKPHRKSARIVGDVLGKYHPHGDLSIYNALVRMGQKFSLRYPLIDGQGNFGSVDGDPPAAMRYCVTGDTIILTKKGLIPIKELSENVENKKTSLSRKTIGVQLDGKIYELTNGEALQSIDSQGYEVDIDIGILSYNGNTNRATKFFDSGFHNIIKVVTNQGYSIKGSENHPILCWSTDLNGKPITVWKTLGKLSKDDIIILNRKGLFPRRNYCTKCHIPKFSDRRQKVKFPTEITEGLAFTLGALVAEGSISDTVQQRLSFNNKDQEYYEKVKRGLLDAFPGISLYERNEYKGWKEFSLHYRDVLDFLYSIGLHPVKSDAKEIPFSVLRSSKKVIASFLQGLFEGDGSIQIIKDARHGGRSSNLTYISKSVKLLRQLKYVLLNFGILTSHLIKDPRNDIHRITILGMESKLRFADEIGFFSLRKTKKLEKLREFDDTRLSKTDFIPYLTDYFRSKYNYRFNEYFQKQNIDRYNSLRKKKNHIQILVEVNDALFLEEIIENNYLFQGIASINQLPEERVYSIRVDSDCHSFIANGFINHNTEARLARISNELFEDLDKETVEMRENFDGSLKEPVYLPAKLPNLLINGTSGIAVGMATNIPPHNLKEIGEAICAAIDIGPDHFQAKDVYKYIKGPDFPTGGIILGDEGILNAIETGRGSIVLRSKTEIIKEGAGKNKDSIIITEIPYQVNKASLIEKIADLVNNGVIPEIADIRDESDRKGLQIYIALKKNSDPNACLNRLFIKTNLQIMFSINNLALFKNGLQPKILTYTEILREFITHRVIVIRKRTVYNLKKAENRLHINEGLLIAINNIDAVVELIKRSENPQEAHQKLIQEFSLSDLQVEAILKMPLSRLTNLQTQKLVTEKQDLLSNITEYKIILADKQKIYGIIKKETRDLMEKYGDARRTEIRENAPNVNLTYEKTIPKEESVIILTENQIIKRMALSHYQSQRRGGKGKRGIKIREEDLIQQMFITSSHDIILLFTQQGRVYSISAYEIPLGSPYSQGKALINYIGLKSEEIIDITAISDFQDAKSLIFVTKKGFIKKTELKEFLNITRNGIICMNLHEGDELVRVQLCDPQYHIFIPTKNGYAIHFEESELRPIGRTAMGVRGLQLRQKNDEVIDLVISKPNARILTITKMGHGKISELNLYRLIHRAGKGVRNIRLSIKNDEVIASKAVKYNEDLLVASSKGILIRIPTKDIRDTGRSTQGVRLMRLDEDDEISSVALCESDENGNED